jgi:hypothetical protein
MIAGPGRDGEVFMATPRLLLVSLAAALAFLDAGAARALPTHFVLDPARSSFAVTGELRLDLGLSAGPIVAPLASQVGTPGAVGGLLPDGSTSDGTVTSLSGALESDLVLGPGPGTLRILSGDPAIAESGAWFPSAADPGVPESAQLGFAFDDGTGALAGQTAMRGATLGAASFLLQLTDVGPGQKALVAGSFVSWQVGGVVLDVTSTLGTFQRTLPPLLLDGDVSGGTLEDLGGGVHELTLPIALMASFEPGDLGLGLPLFLDLAFTGELVATATIAPEPGLSALVGFALAGLALRRARPGAST